MADKRISQLVDRGTVANNDVVPIVVSGAVTTNKATISSIQTFMQGNLDLGVTSVGITLGSSGTDVSVTGSPITTSGNITINIPDASASARGVVNTGNQTFAGIKTFNSTIVAGQEVQLAAAGTASTTFVKNISGSSLTSIGSNGFGFNNADNIYFSGSNKGGGILAFSNTGNQTYTLPNASGTLAFTSDLTGFVTLNTAQNITAAKGFINSGGGTCISVSHTSGSGIAVDITKAGNNEALKVTKTSGSGNAMTVIGGLLSAEAATLTGALNGTSAVFSGNVTLSSSATGGVIITNNNNSHINLFRSISPTANFGININGNGDLNIDETGVATRVTITKTTGAATFSSSVKSLDSIISEKSAGGLLMGITNGIDADIVLEVSASGAATKFGSIGSSGSGNLVLAKNGGNVGIGTAAPSFQLQLSTDSAAKPTTALWTISSDARIKENITPYEKGLNELMQINPINYDYNGLGGFTKGKGGVGIIAQEIADILPDSVNSYPAKLNEDDEEETDVLNFNGHELIYVLINSIKELKTEIDSLKNQMQ